MMTRCNFVKMLALMGLLVASVGSAATANQKPGPAFPKLAVVPFVVEPQSFESTPKRADEEKDVQKLSEEATKQAERVLVSRRVAASTERVESRQAAAGQFVLTGVVRLPVSLPSNIDGAFHRGRFATAEVTLWSREGKVCARQEVQLVWSDGWWTYGGRVRRNRNLDDVLAEFARKASDRAVNRIVRERGFREMLAQCDALPENSDAAEPSATDKK